MCLAKMIPVLGIMSSPTAAMRIETRPVSRYREMAPRLFSTGYCQEDVTPEKERPMAKYPFVQVDAFTDRPLGGNPCAVLFDTDDLTTETMQAIARENNLSETAFVRRSSASGSAVDEDIHRRDWNIDKMDGAGPSGVTLNLALWSDISSGSGSVNTGSSHLQLDTGITVSSIAGIESVVSWDYCQLELKVLLTEVSNPSGVVRPIAFQLYVDANNYAIMYVELDSSGTYTLNCDVYRNGSSVGSYSEEVSTGSLNLRILRRDKTIYFIYNGTIVYYNSDFIISAAKIRIFSSNLTVGESVSATVEWFYWRTYIAIGNELIYAPTVVSDTRIRGYTPPSVNDKGVSAAYAGPSDVLIVGAGDYVLVDGYEYYFEDRLRVMNIPQFDVLLSVVDDDQLITDSNRAKGL